MNNVIVDPVLSIIVPVYNAEAYLEKCIQSLLNQSYEKMEILLIDDGSMDQSAYICDQYEKRDPRIVVLHQDNQGAVVARKEGLRGARGQYVGFVDADDYCDPEMIDTLLKECIKDNLDIINCAYYEGDRLIAPLCGDYQFADRTQAMEFIKKYVLNPYASNRISNNLWTKLFKTDLIREQFLKLADDQAYGEDLICLCRCLLNCKKFRSIDRAFYHYQVSEHSLSHNRTYPMTDEAHLFYHICDVFEKESFLGDMQEVLEDYLRFRFLETIREDKSRFFLTQKYAYPDAQAFQNKSIIIYGAGKVGRDYYSQFSRMSSCNLMAWVDSNPDHYSYQEKEVVSKSIVEHLEYDAIVLAVKDEIAAGQIRSGLMYMNVPSEKIFWETPRIVW